MAGAFNEMADAVESDVAARERAERDAVEARLAAEHASRAKSTFLAAMSHEIRTPMIGVTGMLEVLAPDRPRARSSGRWSRPPRARPQSLLQIIGDILDFSKIEAGRLEIAPTTFALRPLIGVAVDDVRPHGVGEGPAADVRASTSAWPPAHVGDPLRLRQILEQLPLERGQVHRGRRDRGRGARAGRGRRAQTRRARRHRHRRRRAGRAAAASVRGVRAGRGVAPRSGSAAPGSGW